jgi:hypothetical protein
LESSLVLKSGILHKNVVNGGVVVVVVIVVVVVVVCGHPYSRCSKTITKIACREKTLAESFSLLLMISPIVLTEEEEEEEEEIGS